MDVNSELRDAQLEIKDTDNAYSANNKGSIWFNRAANLVKVIYNSTVEVLTTQTYVDNEITTLSDSIKDEGLITPESASDPAAPATGIKRLFAKTDDRTYEQADDGIAHAIARKSEVDSVSSNLALTPFRSFFTVSITVGSSLATEWTNTTGKDCMVMAAPENGYPSNLYVDYGSNREHFLVIGQSIGLGQANGCVIVKSGRAIVGNRTTSTNATYTLYIFPID